MRQIVEATPPVTNLRTVAQLMLIAAALEQRGVRRYRQLAETMERHRNPEVAGLFRRLADEDEGRVASIARRLDNSGAPAMDLSEDRWEFPEIFQADVEDDVGGFHLMTPYRALCMVVREKERMFAYYTGVASRTRLRDISRRAEEIAMDVLDHVIQLRLARRRAFRAEREGGTVEAVSVDVRSLADFVALAETLETMAARRHLALAAAAGALGDRDTAGLLQGIADDEDASARSFSGRAGSWEPAIAGSGRLAETEGLSVFEILRLGLRIVGESFDTLTAVADQADDEAVMREAGGLAEELIPRLTTIRDRLDRIA